MNERVKKILKAISVVLLAMMTILSIYQLIQLLRKNDTVAIVKGIKSLSESGDQIVDLTGHGVKFLANHNEESQRYFRDFLTGQGYQFIGQYGKSDLYDLNGKEILVKANTVFNQYTLFEVFNDDYFEGDMQD